MIAKRVEEYKSYVKDDVAAIRAHKNFFMIKPRYDKLINAFEARLEKIKRMELVSTNNIYADLEEK